MTIEYYTKQVYGNELIYLADPYIARCWYSLTRQRTISMREMELLRDMMNQAEEDVTFDLELKRVFEPAIVGAK